MEATEGYKVKNYPIPTKRVVQCLSLKDNCELIEKYRQIHSAEHIWPEILEGIKSVGILEMEIYIRGSKLVMILELPVDFNWDESMALLAKQPRQAEWEEFVAQFQKALPGQSSDEKWQPMERMFHLY